MEENLTNEGPTPTKDKQKAEQRSPPRCRVRLLSDDPVAEDALGSVEPIADTIMSLISTEEGGKAVALEGTWGSGKSSVVEMLKKKLEGCTDTALFVFDAWAHHRDPLRRSFLEELVSHLSSDLKWTTKECWRKTLDGLRRSSETITTTTTRGLSSGGVATAVAALFAPFGYAIWAVFFRPRTADGSLPCVLQSWPYLLVGLGLAALPFLVACVAHRCELRSWKRKDPQYRKRHPRPRLATVFFRDGTEHKDSTADRTPEPTSIEFREAFQDIMSAVLGAEYEGRELVVVVDNLDRLEPHEARDVWSTMRSLFSRRGELRPEWEKRLWLLVPFDEETPRKLWKEHVDDPDPKHPVQDEDEDTQGVARNRAESESGLKGSLGSAFVDKTFQVRFRVPPPVLSNWRNYMLVQLAIALPDHALDYDSLYRIYNQHGTPRQHPPTPRDIKLFINRLVALHMLWSHDSGIPLVTQAGYVLVAGGVDRSGTQIKNGALNILRDLCVMGDEKPQNHIAALHFNVPVDKAMQVLVGRDIEQALTEGRSAVLRELLKLPGAEEVCFEVVAAGSRSWVGTKPSIAATVARTLGEVAEGCTGPGIATMWGHLARMLIEMPTWGGFEFSVRDADGVIAVLDHCRLDRRTTTAGSVLKKMWAGVNAQPPQDPVAAANRHSNKADWTEGVAKLVGYLAGKQLTEAVSENFRIGGAAADVVGVFCAAAAKGISESITKFYVPELPPSEIVEHLAGFCKTAAVEQNLQRGVRLLLRSFPQWSWSPLAKAAQERLSSSPKPEETAGYLGVLHDVMYLSPADGQRAEELLVSVERNRLHSMFYSLAQSSQPHHEMRASVVLAILEVDPDSAQGYPNNPTLEIGRQGYLAFLANPGSDHQTLDELAGLVVIYSNLGRLLEIGERSAGAKKLIGQLVALLPKWRGGVQYVTPDLLMKHYGWLRNTLPDEPRRQMYVALSAGGKLVKAVIARPFVLSDVELYRDVLQAIKRLVPHDLAAYLGSGLRGLSKTQWDAELSKEGPVLELALELQRRGVAVTLEQGFQDALQDHAEQVLQTRKLPKRLSSRWSELPGLLSDGPGGVFWRNLRDMLRLKSDADLTPILTLYPSLYPSGLAESLAMSQDTDSFARLVVSKIVARKNAAELGALARIVEDDPRIFQGVQSSSRADLSLRVKDALSATGVSDHVRTQLNRIAAVLDTGSHGEVDTSVGQGQD
jgi:hypothetical protein